MARPLLLDLRSTYFPEVKSNFAQVTTEYTLDQIHTYLQGSPVEIQTPTYWNLIDRSMTVHRMLLSPNGILPPPLSQCAFIPARKKFGARLKMLLFQFFLLFFLNSANMNSPNLKFASQ
jgi:hypothetical protein